MVKTELFVRFSHFIMTFSIVFNVWYVSGNNAGKVLGTGWLVNILIVMVFIAGVYAAEIIKLLGL
ncbi:MULTISPECIES: hypothetical protein [Flavobacterium]|uniref:hypothetical protein n=1 Tax=Flavobacterium TaxID=237 RepID=UPI00086C45F3|nr:MULTISPECIES: hypothetical protein [Flavobacterium]MBN9283926.1 hypothetical protein [Flavobacterium sp.]ODS80545.1 MAG: hypothetical protein ABS44_20345 [Chryseobacterium sp. SCN 40-13]OJV73414.1 MAG: hypothetical protein BGO42_09645 [Flavobacterium sp. 40-81]